MPNEISWKEYCSLRPADWKKKEYRHLWLLLYWPLELGFFMLAGRLPRIYHPIFSPLDELIPFSEVWVIPYTLWFLCGLFTVVYTLTRDIRVFRRFMDYMIVTIMLSGAVYLIYPNYFPGRPVEALGWPGTVAAYFEAMPRKNLFTFALSFIYFTDPPRNAFPSEHVVVALGMAMAALDSQKLRRPAFSVPFAALQLLICLSITFTKQHSALDILGALPVSFLGWLLAFSPWIKRPRAAEKARM